MNRTKEDAAERLMFARLGSTATYSMEYLRALRDGVREWLDVIERELDEAEKRREQRSRDAGARFVREHRSLVAREDFDVESYAVDLAASAGLDAEEVAEGMRDALADEPNHEGETDGNAE